MNKKCKCCLESRDGCVDCPLEKTPTITITIEEYMKLRECEDQCNSETSKITSKVREVITNFIKEKEQIKPKNEHEKYFIEGEIVGANRLLYRLVGEEKHEKE